MVSNMRWFTLDRLIAMAAILVTIYLYFKSRRFRSLQCTFGPIGTFDLPIKVSIGGHEIQRLSVVRARLQNTGTEPLKREDMIQWPQLVFPEGAKILSAEIIKQPSIQSASCEILGSTVAFNFELLNYRGDYLELQVVVEGAVQRHPEVKGTVLGLKEGIITLVSPFDERLTSKREARGALATVVVGMLVIMLGGGFLYSLMAQTYDLWPFSRLESTARSTILVEATILDGNSSLHASSSAETLYRPNFDVEGYRYRYQVENNGARPLEVIWKDEKGRVLLRAVVRPRQMVSSEIESKERPVVVTASFTYSGRRRNVRTLAPFTMDR